MDSQEEPEVTGSGSLPPTSRRAEKAPTRVPPSFGLFGTSQDRTQDLFFPPTIGSQSQAALPEPTSPLPYLVQLNASLPRRFESISHRFQDMEAALLKCNTRVESVYRLHETLHEAQIQGTNKCLRVMEHMLSEFNNLVIAVNQGRHPTHPARPATPLPPRPRTAPTTTPRPPASPPRVVITASTQVALLFPAQPTSTHSTRTRLPLKSAEGPKNYVDKPLTPSQQSSPDPLNTPTVAGPSGAAPSYASAAATGGAFQPVISCRNRNHRNRSSRPSPPSPSNEKARQLVAICHDHKIPLTPSLCMMIVNNIGSHLRLTTCPGSVCEVKGRAKGNLVLSTDRMILAQDLWLYRKHIILGLNDSRLGPFDLVLNQWRPPLYISWVPLSYPRGGETRFWHPDDWDTAALESLKADISASNAVEAEDRPFAVGTLAGMKSNGIDHCAFRVNLIWNPAAEELARNELAVIAGRQDFLPRMVP